LKPNPKVNNFLKIWDKIQPRPSESLGIYTQPTERVEFAFLGGMAIRNRVEAKKLDALDIPICYDSELIKPLKTSYIHLISAIFSASSISSASGKIVGGPTCAGVHE
jgi:hypothetical protein